MNLGILILPELAGINVAQPINYNRPTGLDALPKLLAIFCGIVSKRRVRGGNAGLPGVERASGFAFWMAKASANWLWEKWLVIWAGTTCFDEDADAAAREPFEMLTWVALLIADPEDELYGSLIIKEFWRAIFANIYYGRKSTDSRKEEEGRRDPK